MSKAVICDRCGKKIVDSSKVGWRYETVSCLKHYIHDTKNTGFSWDLCPDCVFSLNMWFAEKLHGEWE